MKTLIERMKLLRGKQGWTQEDFADKLGISRSTLANFESGRREPDLSTLQHIAEVLKTTVSYLIGEIDDPRPTYLIRSSHDRSLIYSRILEQADRASLTMSDLADKTQIDLHTIESLRDDDEPDPDILWPIASVLGTSMTYLIGETDDPRPVLRAGQAAHNTEALYNPSAELTPEDLFDLERAYWEIERRRAEARKHRQKRSERSKINGRS